jgi:hypothetical protein
MLRNVCLKVKEIPAAKDQEIIISFANDALVLQSRETVSIDANSEQVV